MSDSLFELGKISVHTTQNRVHAPEFRAEQATKKNSISSDRTTVVNLLRKQGHEDMAKIIKEL